jgi:hypothetical protein
MSDDSLVPEPLDVSWRVLVAVAIVTAGLVAMSFSPQAGCSVTSTVPDGTTTTTEAAR